MTYSKFYSPKTDKPSWINKYSKSGSKLESISFNSLLINISKSKVRKMSMPKTSHPHHQSNNPNKLSKSRNRTRLRKKGKLKMRISFNKFQNNKYNLTNTESCTTMETFMKAKWRIKTKMDGEFTIMLPVKNMMAVLLMMKSMAMEGITSPEEHNMKEIGVVE